MWPCSRRDPTVLRPPAPLTVTKPSRLCLTTSPFLRLLRRLAPRLCRLSMWAALQAPPGDPARWECRPLLFEKGKERRRPHRWADIVALRTLSPCKNTVAYLSAACSDGNGQPGEVTGAEARRACARQRPALAVACSAFAGHSVGHCTGWVRDGVHWPSPETR